MFMERKAKAAHLLGVGLDASDGHKRITRADQFTLVGGSSETHERMTETVVKTVEKLTLRGKTIATAEPSELKDLLQESQPSG
jgi:CO dehydrogenase/acetyl-CoA synthase epsilon subunit